MASTTKLMDILECDFFVVGGPVLQCPVENMPSWHLSRLKIYFVDLYELNCCIWGGGEIPPSYVVILNKPLLGSLLNNQFFYGVI